MVTLIWPQYTRRPFNVLLIGPALSGKRTLATQLLKSSDVFYKIFTAESVPNKPLARMDYVVVMVDMTQAYSLTLLDQALHHMQDRFLTNKMAVMVTKMDKRGKWQFEVERVQELVASIFDVHVFYVNFLNELEKKRTTDQLSKSIKTNTLQYRHVSTPLLNTVQAYNTEDDADQASTHLEEDTLTYDSDQEQPKDDIHEPMSDLKIEMKND